MRAPTYLRARANGAPTLNSKLGRGRTSTSSRSNPREAGPIFRWCTSAHTARTRIFRSGYVPQEDRMIRHLAFVLALVPWLALPALSQDSGSKDKNLDIRSSVGDLH